VKLLNYLKEHLAFDLRALALMRIAVAFVILLDLSIRISDLEAFYANTGVAPLSMIFQYKWNDYYFSFHAISGLWQVQLILFIIAACSALLLLIGYRTRLFTFISWILLLSLHNRNVLILQGGDDLLRMILFWGMFLPWGQRYSVDSILGKETHTNTSIFTLGTLAYVLQISYLYTGSALLKGPEWHTKLDALYYVYSLDQIAYPHTQWLYFYPELLKVLTGIAFWFEMLVPLLFLIPIQNAVFRMVAVILIIGFHSFNTFSLLIGLFPVIGMATSLGLLPSFFMDWFERKTQSVKGFVAQSFLGVSALFSGWIRWKPTLDRPHLLKQYVLGILIVYVLFWNTGNLSFNPYKLADEVRFIGYTLRLDQNWGMFAPGVFKDDGWYVMEARTRDHRTIDLFHPNDSISYKKPANITAMFKNDRWRKYSENFIFVSNDFMRGYFCNYYIRKWNKEHPDQLVTSLSVLYFTELTAPDYKYVIPKKDVLCTCVF
jgi:hypothetical protein